ncbi:hypothetical protein WJX74_000590 [Apatococcus lobatus]|uniref:Uncharacterized protein n=1 Tax=Apatococcus lobatus TaxID=904363 RepID=A0AAW1QWK7_9CHLO
MAATVLRFRSRGIRTPYGCSQAISKEASRSFDQQAPPDHIFLAGRLIGAPGDLSIIWRSAYTHHTLSQVCLTNAGPAAPCQHQHLELFPGSGIGEQVAEVFIGADHSMPHAQLVVARCLA